MDRTELIHGYEHYCDLIDVGHPENSRDRDFVAPLPDREGSNGAATADTNPQAAGLPTLEVGGDEASDLQGPCAMHVEPDRSEELPQQQASTNSEKAVPSTPAEAAAWAHSYCEADPESAKLKILKDERGREYVLYHDCFHCVPIELAPEFMHVSQEEDDGYGSATEASESARDGTKLGTIPEEENEG
jgi:hypothetical protein